MGHIHRLSKELTNQIAAGEVVERPVSIIKELVENSLDAGSKNISVEITDGGKTSIIIKDDGHGIMRDDFSLLFEKHATSKIASLDDLQKISSYGFRGEALASISSISKTTVISKHVESSEAYSINSIDNKTIIASHNNGTSIYVEDIFYNTPARKKFLKTDRTEYRHILDFMNKISIINPGIHFTFISDNKVVFDYQSRNSISQRIYEIYGDDLYENIIEIETPDNQGMKIKGAISSPLISYSNKLKQGLYLNGRVINSPMVSRAISDAYARFIPHGNHGAVFINLIIDPVLVDVNVHPRKLEVRFENEQDIFRLVYHAIKNALEKQSLTNTTSIVNNDDNNIDDNQNKSFGNKEQYGDTEYNQNSNINQIPSKEKYHVPSGNNMRNYSPYSQKTINPKQGMITSFHSDNAVGKSQSENNCPLGRIIGQVHKSYILVETPEGITIFDQHALAERIIYERLANKDITHGSQYLLIPHALSLDPTEMTFYQDHEHTFKQMGFDIHELGPTKLSITAIPEFIAKENIAKTFADILSDLIQSKNNTSESLEEVKRKIWAYTACRSAVKFGDPLSMHEMQKLLSDAVLDYSATCPHGRPVVYDIDLDELKGKYER